MVLPDRARLCYCETAVTYHVAVEVRHEIRKDGVFPNCHRWRPGSRSQIRKQTRIIHRDRRHDPPAVAERPDMAMPRSRHIIFRDIVPTRLWRQVIQFTIYQHSLDFSFFVATAPVIFESP